MAIVRRSLLLLVLTLYTSFAAGPFVWAAMMSLRTTTEIHRNHFALPEPGALGEVFRCLVQFQLRHLFRQLRCRSWWSPC